MRTNITFSSDTTKNHVVNHTIQGGYLATIQNLTDQSITITVTNQDIQSASPTFDTPAGGAVVIASGAFGAVTAMYDGWLITAGASASGTVDIVEQG